MGRGQPSDAAFDLWLRDGLRRNYAEVPHEPIPDCLLRLFAAPPHPVSAQDTIPSSCRMT